METNSYSRIKDFILTNLKKNPGALAEGQIRNEITNTQNLIKQLTPAVFALVLPDKRELEELSEEDWARMEREFETHFNVVMEIGVLIQGDEQRARDTTWWSGKAKIAKKNYYWERYENYIKSFLPPDVAAAIDKDTDLVMDNIGNPELSQFEHKGMVVGHVQSGKTGNYSALVCKAADAGYKFIVVIAGDKNNLRNQTQKRLNESFVGIDKGVRVGVGIEDLNKELNPICLTTTERDFKKQDADKNSQGFNFENVKTPVLIVIKKNPTSLSSVYQWLKNLYKNRIPNHAMLIIDDESDYASINTKEAASPTSINKGIRNLITLFNKGSYVAYTATPYANIFIDHEASHSELGEDLFPKDFIYALEAPSNYFGARRVFLESENRHIVKLSEDDLRLLPFNHAKEFTPDVLPESFYEAIRLFVINVGIRKLRGQEREHNSMLIHVSRFTSVHKKIASAAERYFNLLKKDVSVYGSLSNGETHSTHILKLRETFEQCYFSLPTNENWEAVLNSICQIIGSIIVREVHQSTKIPLEYRDDVAANAIVIGGASLSRGFTLEGLSVSYFIRSTVFYDTLMQMGRWFGYRSGYEDLCRIYLPEQTIDYFCGIIEATDELIDSLKEMAEEKRTPSDFGLSVRQHPDSALQITARNKQKNVYEFTISMNLDGHLKETAYFSLDDGERNENLETLYKFVQHLLHNYSAGEEAGTALLWRDVDKQAVQQFVKNFKVYKTSDPFGISGRMPITFVKKYIEDKNTDWDVALYSGEGDEYPIGTAVITKQNRKFVQKSDKSGNQFFEVKQRQVSSGSAEDVTFDANERKALEKNRRKIRKAMSKPLLMLHILHAVLQTDSNSQPLGDYAAFGISFPDFGNNSNSDSVVAVKINTVAYNQYLEQMDENNNEE